MWNSSETWCTRWIIYSIYSVPQCFKNRVAHKPCRAHWTNCCSLEFANKMKLSIIPVKVLLRKKPKLKTWRKSKSEYCVTEHEMSHSRARFSLQKFRCLVANFSQFFLSFYLQNKWIDPDQFRTVVAQWKLHLVPNPKSTIPRALWVASMSLKRERKLSRFVLWSCAPSARPLMP